jgi:hypothetical protein
VQLCEELTDALLLGSIGGFAGNAAIGQERDGVLQGVHQPVLGGQKPAGSSLRLNVDRNGQRVRKGLRLTATILDREREQRLRGEVASSTFRKHLEGGHPAVDTGLNEMAGMLLEVLEGQLLGLGVLEEVVPLGLHRCRAPQGVTQGDGRRSQLCARSGGVQQFIVQPPEVLESELSRAEAGLLEPARKTVPQERQRLKPRLVLLECELLHAREHEPHSELSSGELAPGRRRAREEEVRTGAPQPLAFEPARPSRDILAQRRRLRVSAELLVFPDVLVGVLADAVEEVKRALVIEAADEPTQAFSQRLDVLFRLEPDVHPSQLQPAHIVERGRHQRRDALLADSAPERNQIGEGKLSHDVLLTGLHGTGTARTGSEGHGPGPLRRAGLQKGIAEAPYPGGVEERAEGDRTWPAERMCIERRSRSPPW